ncbi:MAG: MerR family transcriptional regulator [Coriobacteriales bacterium]|jgi:DNA-binding transcriptional MerR regulator|nr:MerR family transcriptional regulator [Coriobacteriales bacterium]
MKDFISIKEFSELSGIETTTLRYWDDIGLFSPIQRDPRNNYRCYSPQQVIAANFITVMSSLDVPLKAIARAENDRDPESIIKLIENQEKALDREMIRLHECYSIIHTRRELINQGLKVDETEISEVWLEAREIILGPPCEYQEDHAFYAPFIQFCQQSKDLRINPSMPIGGYHESFENFMQAPGQPERFFSLDPAGNNRWNAGKYLVGFTRGYYGEFSDLPARIQAYVKENALSCSGPVYSMYLLDEISYKDPNQYLAQISVAVSKA